MSKPVKKLFDLEIDEVSVVDRAANQHSLIAFSKSLVGEESDLLEDGMPQDESVDIFDETGAQVDIDDLEHGDVVYTENGEELVFIEDDAEDLQPVGKMWGGGAVTSRLRNFGQRAVEQGSSAFGQETKRGRAQAAARRGVGRAAIWSSNNPQAAAGVAGGTALAGAGAGGAAVYGGRRKQTSEVGKSFGDAILEDLSKAVSERERQEVIAKAMDEVSKAQAAAEEAWEVAKAEQDLRITHEFIAKAAEYNLPVAPEVFGPILKSLAETLDDEQLQVLDEIFTSVGDIIYDEIGYVGESSNNSVFDQVDNYAAELVGKADVTREQAVTAMFEANPAAYDAYLSEGR